MRHDPFFSERPADPDQVIKSRPAKAVAFAPTATAPTPSTIPGAGAPTFSAGVRKPTPNMRARVGKCGACPHATSEEKRVAKGSGDFTDCMDRIAPKVKPDDPEAFCAWYEHEQTGRWPGEKKKQLENFGGKKAPQFKERGAPETAPPPGPRVVEVDGDQDSVARTMESDDPTDSWRPGYVTDAPEEHGDLVRPVGKSDAWLGHDESAEEKA